MKYSHILLTGGSGKLGSAIRKLTPLPLQSPSHEELDIISLDSLKAFFSGHSIDAVIHCAALARMGECEKDPLKAIQVNIQGTANLVSAILKKEKEVGKKIKLIHISTDGVYPGVRGNYSEKDETIPYNIYGWTKLGAECAVKTLSHYCIIRSSFFDPHHISYDKSATDVFSSRVTVDYLANAVLKLLDHSFIGVMNVGSERMSDYHRYKEFKPSLEPCIFEDISENVFYSRAKDASLNCDLWREIENETINRYARF